MPLLRAGGVCGEAGSREGTVSETWTVSSSHFPGHGAGAWRVSRPWRPPALLVPVESPCGVLLAGLLVAPGHTREEDQPTSVCAGHPSSTCMHRTKNLMRLEPPIPAPPSPGGPQGQPQSRPPSRFILLFFFIFI